MNRANLGPLNNFLKGFQHSFFIYGLLFIIFFILLPYIISYLEIPDGQVWTPINHEYNYCSDDKYYAPNVQQARHRFFTFQNPVSEKSIDHWGDVFRAGSYRLGSILSLASADFRYGYISSYVLGLILSYALVYFFGLKIGLNFTAAALAALFSIFWCKLFFSYEWDLVVQTAVNSTRDIWFDRINDNFRFIILSHASISGWALLILLLSIKTAAAKTESFFSSILIAVASVGCIYSYPPSAIIFFGMSISLIFFRVFKMKNLSFLDLRLAVIASAILLAFIGTMNHIDMARHARPELLIAAHLTSRSELSLGEVLIEILSHPIFVFSLILIFLRKKPDYLRLLLFFNLIVLILLKLTKLIPDLSNLGDRFISRGFLTVASSIIAFGLFDFIISNFNNLLPSRRARSCAYALIFVSILFPYLIGGFRMADALKTSGSFFIPETQWAAYRELQPISTKKTTVLALEYQDIQLLPVFLNVNLGLPGVSYLSSSSHDQLHLLLLFLKYLEIDPQLIINWFRSYPSNQRLFHCAPDTRRPPEHQVEGSLFLNHIFYLTYLKKIGTTIVFDENHKVSSEFLDAISIEAQKSFCEKEDLEALNSLDYVILSSRFENRRRIPKKPPDGFKIIYDNSDRIIYRRYSQLQTYDSICKPPTHTNRPKKGPPNHVFYK